MRNTALQNKPKTSKKIIPFITTFNPATPNLKKILMKHWHLTAGNHNLAQIFQNSPMVANQKDKSLKDYLVRARIPSLQFNNQGVIQGRGQVTALQHFQVALLVHRELKDLLKCGLCITSHDHIGLKTLHTSQ